MAKPRNARYVICHCGLKCKKPTMVSDTTARAHARRKKEEEEFRNDSVTST